jgi:hypothetical protein
MIEVFLGIGSSDLDYMNNLLENDEDIGWYEVREYMEDTGMLEDIGSRISNNTLTNHLIYSIMRLKYDRLRDTLVSIHNIDIADIPETEFSPFINCLDSWYNNILDSDEIDMNSASDENIEAIYKYLIKQGIIEGEDI